MARSISNHPALFAMYISLNFAFVLSKQAEQASLKESGIFLNTLPRLTPTAWKQKIGASAEDHEEMRKDGRCNRNNHNHGGSQDGNGSESPWIDRSRG
jgi:hypothetical protein